MKIWMPILAFALATPAFAADNCANLPAPAVLTPNGLEQTPVVGSTTWYAQATVPTEAYIKAQADLWVSTGMKAAWQTQGASVHIEISEGWQAASRDGSGNLPANATQFPDGYAATVAYIHADGLLATAYESPYTTSCAGFIGSGLHEQQDINNFASWGADRLEWDGCNVQLLYPSCFATSAPQIYQYAASFVRASGRNMPIMIGNSGVAPWAPSPQSWARNVGFNEWRISLQVNGTPTDLNGNYALFNEQGGEIDQAGGLSQVQKVGFFGHCDYIIGQVENAAFGTFTTQQTQTQFGMCSLWGGPIILGMDISTLTSGQIAMFKNSDVIAIDQDSASRMATRYSQVPCGSATCEVWAKGLHDGTFAIGLLNRDSASHAVTVNFAQFGINPAVRDLWAQSNLGNMTSYTTTVAGYGLALLKATPATSPVQITNATVKNAVIQ